MQNTPRLLIAGREHRNWLRYSVDSDYFTPADGWTVSLGLPAGILPAYLQPWAECQLYMGSDLIMTGRLDTLRRTLNKGQHTLELSGRDLAAVLLDCSAPIFVQRIHVCSDAFCMDAVYFLTKRVFASGREGTTTTLTLKPDGVWLPDTARKPKGKKKKEEEEDDWGE